MSDKAAIIVSFDIEGVHRWPNAPDKYLLLRNPHSHIFHFDCEIPVTDYDREFEFLDVRRELIRAIRVSYGSSEPCDFRSMSCEELCVAVINTISNIYGARPNIAVAVREDAFVGAVVTRQ